MKKLGLYLLVLLVGAMSVTSCDFDDTNTDPSRPTDADLRLILPQAIAQTAYNQSSNNARITGIIMQQFLGFDAQQVAYTDYVIGEDVFNNYWRFGLYAGSQRSCQAMVDKAQEQDAPYYEGIAKVLMAVNYANATSFFGDIPLSQALQGADNLKPSYDSQESVYNSVQTMLDEGIALLSGPAGAVTPSAVDDLIYGGDGAAWVAAAQAFKARYYVHTSERNPDNWNKALQTIDNAAFQDAASAPIFTWGSSQNDNNPLAKFGTERPSTLIIDARFADRMTANADPRQDSYMTFNGDDWEYFGASNLIWAVNASAIPMISYTELMFIKAEGLHRTGASKDDVQAALTAAIQSSMDLVGVDGTDYIAARADLSSLEGEAVLERIMEEAYVAYYGIAFEQTWTNFRRTGYPSLTPSATGANGLNPSGGIPVRFLYPVSESQTNSASLDAAKAAQGGALLDAPLWAFPK